MRDHEMEVAADCIASPSQARTATALRHFEDIMKASVKACSDLRLTSSPSSP